MKKRNSVLVWLSLAGVVLIACLVLWQRGEGLEGFLTEPEEGEGERGAQSWFYEQRAYPLKTIPTQARQNALDQATREERRLRSNPRYAVEFARLEADEAAWTPLGPQPLNAPAGSAFPGVFSGRVTSITLHPSYNGTSNQTVYVGGAQGGVWRSTDNGQNWTPLLDAQPTQAVGSIAIDPTNPSVIYVGTGEGNRSADSYYGAGLLKSTDGGANWRVITGPNSTTAPQKPVFVNAAIPRVAIDPVTPNVIFVATTFGNTASASDGVDAVEVGKQIGLWKSTDGGDTWRNVDPDGSAGVQSAHDVTIDPLNHNIVYAAIRSRGVYRSKSGGEPGTWELLTNGIANGTGTTPFRRIAIAAGPAIAPSTAATLYASFSAASDNSIYGFYKSTNGGDSWTQITTPPTEDPQSPQAGYNMAIAIDPTNSNTVYYGGQYHYTLGANCMVRSTDGGQTWVDMNSDTLHPDTHAIAIAHNNPNIVFTGNDGGIWRTDAANAPTTTWTTLNSGLSFTQFQSVGIHPTDANYLIGGTQDNGTNRHTGALGWTQIRGSDGGFALIDQSNPAVMYQTIYNQTNFISPSVSTNSGATWRSIGCRPCTALQGRLNPTDRVSFYAPMALNPAFTGANGNVVYIGTNRLYRTENRGTTWTGLGTSTDGYGSDLTKGQGTITTIAAHPKVDSMTSPATEIVWVGTGDGNIQVTSNAGSLASATFTNVTKAPLPNRFVTDIAADSNNADRAVAAFSGFDTNTPTTPGHVFLTTNRGSSWTNISGNLPDVPTLSVVLDPNNTNRIWVGTDIGVFQTTDGGATWLPLNNGMPKVAVFMLRLQPATGNLVAATHGRGMFRMRTLTGATSVSGASYLGANVAQDSIVSVFGVNLSTVSAGVAATNTLPTSLGGTSVTVRDSQGTDRLAPLFFAGALQVNYLVPTGTAPGAATVTIRNALGETSIGTINITAVTPGLFTGNADGAGPAVGKAIRVRNGVQTPREDIVVLDTGTNKFIARPLDFAPATEDLFVELYGTGLRNRSSQANVSCEIDGVTIPVEYASVAPGFFGLDQVNIKIPASLDNRGEIDLTVIVDGQRTKTLKINIR